MKERYESRRLGGLEGQNDKVNWKPRRLLKVGRRSNSPGEGSLFISYSRPPCDSVYAGYSRVFGEYQSLCEHLSNMQSKL
jgi:hypothetical protein